MAIPDFNGHGLLPEGVHTCSLSEIRQRLAWNARRALLFARFVDFLHREIQPRFSHPVFCDGSFVTDKDEPSDIDMVLDLRSAPVRDVVDGIVMFVTRRAQIKQVYMVDFLVNAPANSNFCEFFQYVGTKSAQVKGLAPEDKKGILRIA